MGRPRLRLIVKIALAALGVVALAALRIFVSLHSGAGASAPPAAPDAQAAVAASTAELTMTLKQSDIDDLRRVMDTMNPGPEELERRAKEMRAVEAFDRRYSRAPEPPARAPEPPARAPEPAAQAPDPAGRVKR